VRRWDARLNGHHASCRDVSCLEVLFAHPDAEEIFQVNILVRSFFVLSPVYPSMFQLIFAFEKNIVGLIAGFGFEGLQVLLGWKASGFR
jgi:hypothetical protein